MTDKKIEDSRKMPEFRSISFSNYKKSDVRKELIKSIISNKIEDSCYWSAELICAGHFMYLWEIIFNIISKNIHIGNPKLPIYIELRLNSFKDIINNGYTENIIKVRNNDKIRKLFAEIMAVLCFSKKKNSFDVPKIKQTDFNFINLTERLSAKTKSLINKVFKKEDPHEIFIPLNEFAWNISKKVQDNYKANYWIEWILEYHKICKKNKTKKICALRNLNIDKKFQGEMIWIVWDLIIEESRRRRNGLEKIIMALLNLYSLKYKEGSKHKRKLLIYYAVSLLTENVNLDISVINNKDKIDRLKQQINVIYGEIKKNEKKPSTNYLFKGVENNNVEKTANKLEKLNMIGYIPRT